jgi:hypothetical protein
MKNFKTVLIVAGLLMAWAFVPGSQADAAVASCTVNPVTKQKYCSCSNPLGCFTSAFCVTSGCPTMKYSLTMIPINGYDPNALRTIIGSYVATPADFADYNAGASIATDIILNDVLDWTLGATAVTGDHSVDVIGSMTLTPSTTTTSCSELTLHNSDPANPATLTNYGYISGAGHLVPDKLRNGGTLAQQHGSPSGIGFTGSFDNYRILTGLFGDHIIWFPISGTLAFELGGTVPCGVGLDCGSGGYHSKLYITGEAVLSGILPGVLAVTLSPNYLPLPANTFEIIEATSIPIYWKDGILKSPLVLLKSQCFWDVVYDPALPPSDESLPSYSTSVSLTNGRCTDAGNYTAVASESVSTTIISGTITGITSDNAAHYTYSWKEKTEAKDENGNPVLDEDGNPIIVETVLFPSAQVLEDGGCPFLLGSSIVPLSIGQHTLTLEVTRNDPPAQYDAVTASDDMILSIDNAAPHAVPTGAGRYLAYVPVMLGGEVSDFDGDLLTYQWLDGDVPLTTGTIQTTAGGGPATLTSFSVPNLGVGDHTITLVVSDGVNNPVSASIAVTIMADVTAPTLSPTQSTAILWPPNHRMVNVTIQANATDNSGLIPTLSAKVTSSEPQEGLGDGDTPIDWTEPVIDPDTGTITLQLRAERSGKGGGRTYTVAITATDESGNASTANVTIIVPHDKSKK